MPFACPILAQPGGRASPSPQVEIDHSGGASNDRVYVPWSDLRPGSGSTRCAVTQQFPDGTPPQATHLTFESFVASAASGALPGGSQASSSVRTRLITDGEAGGQSNSDDWFAWLAVDQTGGQAWADVYSTRDDSTRKKTNFYARSVTPNGSSHTLGTLTKVSSAQSNYTTGPCCNFGNDYGDYTGIAATGGIAYPVWTDNSTGDGDPFTFTTPPSGTPPGVTTGNASSVGQTSATLNGTVDPNGQSTQYHFEYGTTTGYGSSTATTGAGSGSAGVPVSANVSGLAAGTTYHFRLVATNAAGTSFGGDNTFTTRTPPPSLPPSASTEPADGIGEAVATLHATINPNGQATGYHFDLGTSPGVYTRSVPTSDATIGSGSSGVPVSQVVSGLSPNTTYYFRVAAQNGSGPGTGSELSFKTAPPSPAADPPVVTTGGATLVSQSSATVNGTVNPNGQATTWRFQYGRTTSYGSQTSLVSAGFGNGSLPASASLQFLAPGTTYHYRLVATNGAGTGAGVDRTFTTSTVFPPSTPLTPSPPLDTSAPVLQVSRRRVRLGPGRRLRVRVKCGADEPEHCKGMLRLYTGRRRLRLAAARFDIPPGRTARVRLRLSRRGARLLKRKGRLRILAIARAGDSAGNLGEKRARFTLLLPRR